MTTPRPWPNEAKESRDRAAELAQQIADEARRLAQIRSITGEERIGRSATILDHALNILRLMEKEGAPTRP